MSEADPGQRRQPTEEELRAAYEAEIKKVRVEHVLLEQIVTLVNLGRRRSGLSPGTEDERDPEQVRLAIDSIRALMPHVERAAPQQVPPIREALSQLQLAYVRIGGEQPSASGEEQSKGGEQPSASGEQQPESKAQPSEREEPGPAQRSGRLWVPGQ